MLLILILTLIRASGSGLTTLTLVTQKFSIYGQRVVFQNFGRRNNCAVEVFLKWLDQSHTPSPAPAIKAFKGSQQGILASVRCNNLVTTFSIDITGGWGCFWCMDAYVWVGGGVLCLLPCGAREGTAGLAFFLFLENH